MPELIRSSMEMWDGSRNAKREAIYLINGAYCSTICSCPLEADFAAPYSGIDSMSIWSRDDSSMISPLSCTERNQSKRRQKNLILPSRIGWGLVSHKVWAIVTKDLLAGDWGERVRTGCCLITALGKA